MSNPSERLKERTRGVLDMMSDVTGIPSSVVRDSEIIVKDEYIGESYGRPSEACVAAIRLLGENEGIILDPIYSGKGMAGMLNMLETKQLDSARDVCFCTPEAHRRSTPTQTSCGRARSRARRDGWTMERELVEIRRADEGDRDAVAAMAEEVVNSGDAFVFETAADVLGVLVSTR